MSKKIDMLHGPLVSRMILFALPLIATGILQQSFNSVDFAIVGRFVGPEALAAVGANGPVFSLMINLFIGISIGANVVIANNIGNGNSKGVRNAVATSSILSIICGVIVLIVGQIVARPLLILLDTPMEVLDQAVLYLRILILGMPFLIIYNFGAAILRAVGDTRRPFIILVIAGFINVGLNILFVVGMNMGVAGVAWGTSISNVVMAALIIVILVKENGDIRLDFKAARISSEELSKILKIGLPAGLQSSIFSVSNVFVLSAINSFGASATAGSATALTYELYCYFVMNAFGQTAVAFAGQNWGAGNVKRCWSVFKVSLILCTCTIAVLNLLIAWQHDFFLMPFTTDPEVIKYATIRLTVVLAFQFIASYYEMAGSVMRGLGRSITPAVITIFGSCVLRVIWVSFLPKDASFTLLMSIYPISWMVSNILMVIAFYRLYKKINASIA